jgi:ribosomal protein S18 acetylase RimI-like enzyme
MKSKFGYCDYAIETDYVHIYNLYVFPQFRRQGKARKILQNVIDTIRKTGYLGPIQIVAEPKENSISLKKLVLFYKSLGLEVFKYYG